MEWDPATGAELPHEFVEVGPAGTVESWTWVANPSEQHPLDRPFAFALIRLDGATTPLLHAVDAGGPDGMADGMRVAPRWRGTRAGRIDDIVCFVPGEAPRPRVRTPGGPTEPVTRMDYLASITYRNPVPEAADRATEASREHRLLGLSCPACGRVYAGGRGYCPVDAIELGPDCEVDLPRQGHHHQLRHRHPGAVPGPDRDRAVRPGVRPARRYRRGDPLLGGHRTARRPGAGGPAGRRRCGRRPPRRPRRAAAWEGAGAPCSGGSPTASPTSTTPTS